MQTRLSDIDRKLLSAWHDGELSGSEQKGAEELLERQPEARAYVRELEALHELSASAYPAVLSSSLPATFGTKLTSSAIRTAARGAATGSGTGMSWWGVAASAFAASAAVVVVGVVLLRQPPERPVRQTAEVVSPSAQPLAARLEPDSSFLVVPAMSSQELMDFALTGRVPIDESREKYLTVGSDSGGSISLAVRPGGTPPAFRASLDLRELPGFDSIGHALRTSALQSASHGLAVRTDLPSLRLRAIQRLDETMPRLPADIRRELAAARAELEREVAGLRMAAGHRSSPVPADRRKGADGGVQYVVLASEPSDVAESPTGDRPAAGHFAGLRKVEVDRADLGTLESFVRQEPVVTVAGSDRNAAGPSRGFSRRWPEPVPVGGPPQEVRRARRQIMIQFDGGRGFVRYGGVDLDSMMRMTDQTLEQTEQILRQADSIRRAVHSRHQKPDDSPEIPRFGGSSQGYDEADDTSEPAEQ